MDNTIVLGALAALLLTACAKQETVSITAAAAATGSPVWAVQGRRNTVYLAGSVHALKGEDAALPAAFDRAYADSRTLMMEVAPDADAGGWLQAHGNLGEGTTLKDAIGAERYGRVQSEALRLGLSMAQLDVMKPWIVGIQLTQTQYVKLGFDLQNGVEPQLLRRAQADGREIRGLATASEQMGALDELSIEDQAIFLEAAVSQMHELEAETADVVSAWRVGDTDRLAVQLGKTYDVSPNLYRALLTDRNQRWLPKIEKLLSEKDNHFVVVGALHLVGEAGLLEMLRRDGFKVQQLR